MAEIKPVRVFTRDDPCTKVDIHNCFMVNGIFSKRPVVEARGEIGINTPKYLIREAYAIATHERGIDYLQLTASGKAWLTNGLARFLELHPHRAADVVAYQTVRKGAAKPATAPTARPARISRTR